MKKYLDNAVNILILPMTSSEIEFGSHTPHNDRCIKVLETMGYVVPDNLVLIKGYVTSIREVVGEGFLNRPVVFVVASHARAKEELEFLRRNHFSWFPSIIN